MRKKREDDLEEGLLGHRPEVPMVVFSVLKSDHL